MNRRFKVLFVCGANECRSQMAEGYLRHMAGERVEVHSAGVRSGSVRPPVIQVMREIGIDISSHTSKTVADLGPIGFDLVITLCDEAMEYCAFVSGGGDQELDTQSRSDRSALFAGAPVHVHWSLADPHTDNQNEEQLVSALREARDVLKGHVRVMNDHYLSPLSIQRGRLEGLADIMASGIVGHDEQRHIYLFNKAAERITGMPREKVIGMDCHLVFPPDGLCGSQCAFQGGNKAEGERRDYEVVFTSDEGVDKRLKITAAPMEITPTSKGVLAVIRDVTEVSDLRFELRKRRGFHGMAGVSESIQEVFRTTRLVGTSDYPVLISGESGTGKELVASAIHAESRRNAGPFVPVNCGALPENILESELFGHVRGAFTGAIREKKGRFELAHGGTLFLDEVSELSPSFQIKLLRVLQEKRFEKVGGEKQISVDVRIIAATNRDLREKVQRGEFREDLFYRICVVPIFLPPLRERREDVPYIAERALERIRGETGKSIRSVSEAAMRLLMGYHWPGNIRELINALQYAAVRCDSEEIEPHHLPPELNSATWHTAPGSPSVSAASTGGAPLSWPTRGRRTKLTREAVERALVEAKGNKSVAARALGVGRSTLYRFMDAFGPF